MADNYLEKRYEEVFGRDAGHRKVPGRPGLDTLLLHNRSYQKAMLLCMLLLLLAKHLPF